MLNTLTMDVHDAIYTRRSVRQFTAEPVSEASLRALIDHAVQAPSAVNEQPWSFAVVRDRAMLVGIANAAKAFVLRNPPATMNAHHVRKVLGDPDFDIFHGAPALVVISCRTHSPWAVEDCALAAENFMLAARSIGLGTCWIGYAQGWLGTSDGKAMLRLPELYIPVAPLVVGHPAFQPPPIPRADPEITWIDA